MAYVILFLFTYGSAQNIFAKGQTLPMKALDSFTCPRCMSHDNMAKDVLEIKKAERESNTKTARPNLLAGRLFIFLGLHNYRCIFFNVL